MAARTWISALSYCQDIGGNLASVHSREENEFIFALNPNPNKPRWLGIVRDNYNVAGFQNVDGSTYDAVSVFQPCTPGYDCNWIKGEPNNVPADENCVQMGHPTLTLAEGNNNGAWNDVRCHNVNHFVCKKTGA